MAPSDPGPSALARGAPASARQPAAGRLARVAFVGNSLPRRCGIATFTSDLQQAVAGRGHEIDTAIVAMTDHAQSYDYPADVRFQVADGNLADYVRAAEFINSGGYDAVSLQHEFGIFGGPAGSHVLTLLSGLAVPAVTTLHTVLAEPTAAQRRVLSGIVEMSAKVVVMSEKARELMRTVYRAPADRIEMIPHGIPDFGFAEPDRDKLALGLGGRHVILTFGLLCPNKGIEYMIDAMPAILAGRPDAVYVVLGATHPNLVRDEGEAYRESLVARARALGIGASVLFLDRFVDRETLLHFISACDVYVTPYLNEAQMTSGTLAYSFGLGKAVVSTPYWHARELLAGGKGVLVPFADAGALGREIAGLLTDDARRDAMRAQAYAESRSMTWENTAERYISVFESARRGHLRVIARAGTAEPVRAGARLPDMNFGHLHAMCDDTGIYQHAVHDVPNRAHGYCVDDNARALLLACRLGMAGETRMPAIYASRFAAFVQHAWNPVTRRFRNFMDFGRGWLEESGSEDSHARTLWALGECARSDASLARRDWAAGLFAEALAPVEAFGSPRAWAFALLGLDAYCARFAGDAAAARLRRVLADRLLALVEKVGSDDWMWFEESLAYDNARLAEALIVSGTALRLNPHVSAGLAALRWLVRRQTGPLGVFRPVGTESFGTHRATPDAFDQQPLEATATIAACHAAWRADGDGEWLAAALRAFAWFAGDNDLSQPLVDPETGACRDGLHPDRPNANCGGESVISYLLALAEIRQIARLGENRTKFAPRLA
jgi:glycosyltransferase involved in cell wall biosynthesis